MRPRTHQSVQAAETLRCFRSRAHRQPEMREGEATAMPPARRAQPPSPPPWEALPLVAPLLDAASLAAASCVSTSWHAAFAADYLWARLCARHYPSALGLLRHLPDDRRHQCSSFSSSSSPYRRLFALFRSASARRRALPAPRLALADVAFAVDISAAAVGESILSFAVAAAEAGDARNAAGLFLFGVDLRGRSAAIGPGEWCVRWTAVRTGNSRGDDAPAAVLMMDAKVPAARATGAVGLGGRGEAGVSVSLPAPGCGGARLEAEVAVELAGEEKLKLECSKPVIVAGDLNCARQSIDIHNPQAKTEARFTDEERESFEENFSSKGLVDTFRKQHPNAVAFTFWGENQRITNKGWRLDYFLASGSIADKVHDSYILPDVSFSDHSPIGLVLKL